MNVLVTGATGFIGRNLVQELAQRKGYENIFCLVRNEKKAARLKPFGVKLIYADITRRDTLEKIKEEKIDVVFHCAGYVGNKRKLLEKINVLGTENICELSRQLKVERMVYLSSIAVVSGNKQIPLTEDLPYNATGSYGQSKIEAEKKVLEFRRNGLRAVIIRPCMIYGEEEPHLLKLLCFLLEYKLLPLVDEGKRKLHLVYIKNVIELMLYSVKKEEFLKDTFFIADNEVLSVKKIFGTITNVAGVSSAWNVPEVLKPVFLRIPFLRRGIKFFLKDRIYSIEKIKSLNFTPPCPAKSAFEQSVRYFIK